MNKYHERFWTKVEKNEDCLIWTAFHNEKGYGYFYDGERMRRAHKYVYEELVEPIPVGFEINHLCRTRNCVNPEHLEIVTHKENCYFDKVWKTAALLQKSKTRCKHGHPFDEVNTYITSTGNRQCKACRASNTIRYRKQLKENRGLVVQ